MGSTCVSITCLLCQTSCRPRPAIVSGFISELVFSEKQQATQLLECPRCGLRFFERRYTDEEMTRLYGDYRGKHYFEIRHRHEPWYTERLNQLTTASDTLIRQKQAFLSALFARHCPRASSVLDYGGDRGQFLPNDIPQRFLFDLSASQPVEGVTKVLAAALETQRFDCVIALNILEHVSNPLAEMRRISALLNPGGVLIASVPEEYPPFLPGYDLCARVVRFFALRIRLVAMGADFFSKVMKFKFGVFPPLSLASLSEHINFYTPDSLALLAKHNNEVLVSEFQPEPEGVYRRSLVVVARNINQKRAG